MANELMNKMFLNALAAPPPQATDQSMPLVEQLLSGKGYEQIDRMARPLFRSETPQNLFGFAGPEIIGQVAQTLQAERQNEQTMRRAGADWIATQLAIPGSALERKATHLKMQDALMLKQLASGLRGAGGGGRGRGGGGGGSAEGGELGKGYFSFQMAQDVIDRAIKENPIELNKKFNVAGPLTGDKLKQALMENRDQLVWRIYNEASTAAMQRALSMKGAYSNAANYVDLYRDTMAGDLAQHGYDYQTLGNYGPDAAQLGRMMLKRAAQATRGGGEPTPTSYDDVQPTLIKMATGISGFDPVLYAKISTAARNEFTRSRSKSKAIDAAATVLGNSMVVGDSDEGYKFNLDDLGM